MTGVTWRILGVRWSRTQGHDSTLNCEQGHVSKSNYDPGQDEVKNLPGSYFNIEFWPIYLSSIYVSMTREGVKTQQRAENSRAKEGHNSTKNPLNFNTGSWFSEGVQSCFVCWDIKNFAVEIFK